MWINGDLNSLRSGFATNKVLCQTWERFFHFQRFLIWELQLKDLWTCNRHCKSWHYLSFAMCQIMANRFLIQVSQQICEVDTIFVCFYLWSLDSSTCPEPASEDLQLSQSTFSLYSFNYMLYVHIQRKTGKYTCCPPPIFQALLL